MNRRSWLVVLGLVVVAAVVALLLRQQAPVAPQVAPTPHVVRIGAILPLTGDYAPYGKRSQKAFQLGLEDGGLRADTGYVLVVEDDGADPKRAVAAANKLLSTDQVEFILGPFPSGGTIAVGPVVRNQPVILITPSSTAPSISGMAPNVFRTCPSDTAEAEIVAKALLENGVTSAAVLYLKNEYGEQLRQAFASSFEAGGGKVAFADAFAPATKNFRTLVAKSLASGAAATYLIGYDELQGLIRTLVQLGGMKTQPVYTNIMINSPAILSGLQACTACKSWRISYPVWASPEQQEKIKAFETRLGEQSDPFAINSYNSGRVMARVLSDTSVKTTEQRIQLMRQSVFEGLAGQLQFDAKGDVRLPVTLQEVFK